MRHAPLSTLPSKTDMSVATEIANQLGGTTRLTVMIGAKHFTGDAQSLSYRHMRGSRRINHTKITLNGKDLYDIKFYRVGTKKFEVVEEITDVYCDQLISTLEKSTGLAYVL